MNTPNKTWVVCWWWWKASVIIVGTAFVLLLSSQQQQQQQQFRLGVLAFSLSSSSASSVSSSLSSKAAPPYNNFGAILQDDVLLPTTDTDTEHEAGVSTTTTKKTKKKQNRQNLKKGYWCDYCSLGFNKQKYYLEHMDGKPHHAVVEDGNRVWQEYQAQRNSNRTTSTSHNTTFWGDATVTKLDVAKAWSLDTFVEGLPARGRSSKQKTVMGTNHNQNSNIFFYTSTNDNVNAMETAAAAPPAAAASSSQTYAYTGNNAFAGRSRGNQISPKLRMQDLPPSKRASLYRYLHSTNSGIECLLAMIEHVPAQYVRIKEVLESMEVYFQFWDLLYRNKKRHKQLTHVYDIGCGHGLVGMLIAAACPHIEVLSLDRLPQKSYRAQQHAFQEARQGRPLTNLQFQVGDLHTLRDLISTKEKDDTSNDETNKQQPQHGLILCVHGCKELTHESIEFAKERDWGYLALPCCLQVKDQLCEKVPASVTTTTIETTTNVKISSDHTRYALLCGAMAGRYIPEKITTIDSRITGRNIVLASAGE